jgi:decaprenylphospho-beta-D-ribofuranose 2-oxidase
MRGLGRSYGDAAQSGGGTVIDMTRFDAIVSFDRESGELTAQAGCSLARILDLVVPTGWFLPVVPGTRMVTVGGSIAFDVHGKNHHRDGSFGMHVLSLSLLTPDGVVRKLDPIGNAEEFWATVADAGLTGAILDATLQLIPIAGSTMRVTTEQSQDLEDTFARLSESDGGHRYSVAWVDGAAGGRKFGRSVLMQGDHARDTNPRTDAPIASNLRSFGARLSAPSWPSLGPLLRGRAVAVFNEDQYRAKRVGAQQAQSMNAFFFPLDGINNWNRLYGRHGFLQYQFVVPHGHEAVITDALATLNRTHVFPTLVVLKRFGSASPAPLSFPIPGWTVAIDLALPNSAARVLDRIDEKVAAAGGRVYLAKDSRLRGELLQHMYPRLADWQALRERLDPTGRLQHDLQRRLDLTRSAA